MKQNRDSLQTLRHRRATEFKSTMSLRPIAKRRRTHESSERSRSTRSYETKEFPQCVIKMTTPDLHNRAIPSEFPGKNVR
jgi:hypothetical protein